MKSIRHTFLASALLVSFCGLALAQTAGETKTDTPHAHRTAQHHAKMGEHRAKHLNELKGKLKLEAGQESAWTAFAQSMQASGQPMPHPDRAALQKLSTPERIDLMQAHKAARDAQMQKRAEATKTFYAALNSEQKKVLDAETSRMMHRMRHKMGRHGEHHAHH